MSARPETLEYHGAIYDTLSKKFLDEKHLNQYADEIRDEKSRELVAHSVIQVFSLTQKSFAPTFSELCDCLVKSRMVTDGKPNSSSALVMPISARTAIRRRHCSGNSRNWTHHRISSAGFRNRTRKRKANRPMQRAAGGASGD